MHSASRAESRIATRTVAFSPAQRTEIAWPDLSLDSLMFSTATCPWPSAAGRAPYSFLAHTLATLSSTRSRILILNTLTNCLRILTVHDPPSLLPALYLLSNGLAPVYSPQPELGIGSAVITKALQHVSGLSSAALRKLYAQSGDPGDVAFAAKASLRTLVPHSALLIDGVYKSLLQIANAKGQGSAKSKQSVVEKLLLSAQGEEARYVVRTLGQNLRVGAVRTTLLSALARAMVLDRAPMSRRPDGDSAFFVDSAILRSLSADSSGKAKKKGSSSQQQDPVRELVKTKFSNAEAAVRRVFVRHPNYDHIIEALLEHGLETLSEHVRLEVGIPLHPALGTPTRSLEEVYERLGDAAFSAEMKLDGQRGQIHAFRDEQSNVSTKIFSRHLEDMTDKYPDIVSLVEHIFSASPGLTSFIIDSEIVAVDKNTNALRSFQELSNRARKDVQLKDVKVAVCVFAFDLMYLNGEVLIQEAFRRRRELLRTRIPPLTPADDSSARLDHMANCDCEDATAREAVEAFWQESLDLKTEGLMIKASEPACGVCLLTLQQLLDHTDVVTDGAMQGNRRKPLPSSYEPDTRGSAWLKLKRDYVTGLGDSLDLVPIGAWRGPGRKNAWWSPILLACYDSSRGQLVAVCKCMSGFSDAFYKSLNERYPEDSDTCNRKNLWNVESGGLRPGVFFKPAEVWEIKGADITLSPISVAAFGAVTQERGLSLRFPRFIRLRDDKGIEQASGPDALVTMWKSQKREAKGGADEYELIDVEMDEDGSEVEEDDSAAESVDGGVDAAH
ncbi:ATP-dependent DNA ligase [Exidia glandulosa HHB12029]|uniref:DNA ligase n=1 Tax=Exidia glandulosa HHB12029 TaxID=1314781 RepID=A0A165F080_EXIGL|nr:ATP-dependent DNA ligase [Exidia glandulosa HHB12029]